MATYTAIEAVIKEGRIYPNEPERLPKEGKLLLIVLDEKKTKPTPEIMEHLLGWLDTKQKGVDWQKQVRSEWDHRITDT